MRLFSHTFILATALVAGLWSGAAAAAPLSPSVQNPVIGGQVNFDGDLSTTGNLFVLVLGDLSAPAVFDAPVPTLSGGSFLLTATGTPGVDLAADFIIDGVGGDFDPNLAFLSGVLEDFGYDANLITLLFGGVVGEAASLFGPRVLVSFFDFGLLPQDDGPFSGVASYTIQSVVAPVPLPMAGMLLLSGLGSFCLFLTRRRTGVASGTLGTATLINAA